MIIKAFIVTRIGIFVFGLLASYLFPKNINGNFATLESNPLTSFWLSLAQWDGGNFLKIANSGYLSPPDYVFFPLYSILVKVLTLLTTNPIVSALIISNLAFVLFLFVLFRFVKRNFPTNVARNAVITYLFFPTSFYTAIVYSEALFLLFVILFFDYLVKRKYVAVAFLAVLAQLTRFLGIFLAVAFILDATRDAKNRKIIFRNFIYLPIMLLGTFAYGMYLQISTSDPFLFLSAQTEWLRFPQDPISTIVNYIWRILSFNAVPLNDYLDLAVTLIFISLLIMYKKLLSPGLWAFSILVLLIPASTGTLTSIPRYALTSIGTFIIIGSVLHEKPSLKAYVWIIMLFLQIILFAFFINGYWVA